MKRRIWLYALTCVGCAVLLAGTVVAFVFAEYVVGALGVFFTAVAVCCLIGEVAQDTFYIKCEKLFQERKFDEEKTVLDGVERRHIIFPFVRVGFYLLAIQNACARDDLTLAKSYISRLRQPNETGLRYRTAYVHILILLDEGDAEAARTEYEDFRTHNLSVPLYASQLEVLQAVFKRLFTHSDEPLPEGAVNSYFPVVKRILGKHFEERSAREYGEWND